MALSATVGVATTLAVWVDAGSPTGYDEMGNPGEPPTSIEGIPAGMTDDGSHKVITGTPTTSGEYVVTFRGGDDMGNPVTLAGSSTVTVAAVVPDPEDPEDPPVPELDPFDLYDALARDLAPRVAAFVGRPGEADVIATAAAQVPVVTEYVRGYTRGRGFTDEAPPGPLRAVIVSGVARLATNPEQVSVFTTGDYSERPAQLAGWTLTELGVLRRYRRTTA